MMFGKATPYSLAPIEGLVFSGRMLNADSARHQESILSQRWISQMQTLWTKHEIVVVIRLLIT